MRFFDLFGKNETLFSDLGPFSFLMNPTAKIASKSLNKVQFSPNKSKKSYKTTSIWDHKRKFLRPKFWSHGTNLGSLGLISHEDTGGSFQKWAQIIPIYVHQSPRVTFAHGLAEKLAAFPTRCARLSHRHHLY